ncbi:MAG: hypothetical protein M1828_004396 [Chrysothrix sp. TS-e1954]|nr:MAG: hypothetical protein M1828_004396 [Chrysothrix sp. TS-e1954]
MAPLHYDVVDVFTTQRYTGNQLAIIHVPRSRSLSKEEKQKIAIEFGYSESVFLAEADDGTASWEINIYTPEGEIPLAGHPVIGTAWLLGQKSSGHLLSQGVLVPEVGETPFTLAWLDRDNCEPRVEMPQTLHKHAASVSVANVINAQADLETYPQSKAERMFPVVSLVKGMTFVLVELDSIEALGNVKGGSAVPQNLLDQGWEPSLMGWYFYYIEIGAPGPIKLHCRMVEKFGEDAATGSAACTLTGYLSQLAKTAGLEAEHFEYIVTQGEHMGRKSTIKTTVSVTASAEITSIVLQGNAVHVMSGILSEDGS